MEDGWVQGQLGRCGFLAVAAGEVVSVGLDESFIGDAKWWLG